MLFRGVTSREKKSQPLKKIGEHLISDQAASGRGEYCELALSLVGFYIVYRRTRHCIILMKHILSK
jgi:hypothetical protein